MYNQRAGRKGRKYIAGRSGDDSASAPAPRLQMPRSKPNSSTRSAAWYRTPCGCRAGKTRPSSGNAFSHSWVFRMVSANQHLRSLLRKFGRNGSRIVLTARSGQHLAHRFQKLGFNYTRNEIDVLYAEFLKVADRKKKKWKMLTSGNGQNVELLGNYTIKTFS